MVFHGFPWDQMYWNHKTISLICSIKKFLIKNYCYLNSTKYYNNNNNNNEIVFKYYYYKSF